MSVRNVINRTMSKARGTIKIDVFDDENSIRIKFDAKGLTEREIVAATVKALNEVMTIAEKAQKAEGKDA
jgi:hypothetical protein